MKRLIVCCDGTWYSADKGADNLPSNVARLSRMIARQAKTATGETVEQVVYYQTGVGTGNLNWMDSMNQGATGAGLEENVITAYHFIANNYDPGDENTPGDEIFLFGFSRGAYTARAIAGCLTEMGLLEPAALIHFPDVYAQYKEHRSHPDKQLARSTTFHECTETSKKAKKGDIDIAKVKGSMHKVKVKVVGVWDTVGSLGMPDSMVSRISKFNKGLEFHDTALNSNIEHAFHALALDEHRGAFTPTLWYLPEKIKNDCDLKQCWFPGYHADIGGGTTKGDKDHTEIDEISLAWMCDLVDGLLAFDPRAVRMILKKDELKMGEEKWASGEMADPINIAYKLNVVGGNVLRAPGTYHEEVANETNETMHPSIRHRMDNKAEKYDPPALKERGGWVYEKVPSWSYVAGDGTKGSEWVRPGIAEKKGYISSTPHQPEIRLKEWVIMEKPGMTNFETILLPDSVKKILKGRNMGMLSKAPQGEPNQIWRRAL